MSPGLSRRFQRRSRLFGLLTAVLALVSQLALGAVVPPADTSQASLAALDAVSIFCQSGSTTGSSDQPPTHHHPADYALCPFVASLALPAAILTPEPLLPKPSRSVAPPPRTMPEARAPPSHAFAAAYPRGPPNLA